MARKRTIKPAESGKKEGAAIGLWVRLNMGEIAALERLAGAQELKGFLTRIAQEAIERKAKTAGSTH